MKRYYFVAVVHIEADDEDNAAELLRTGLEDVVFLDGLMPLADAV